MFAAVLFGENLNLVVAAKLLLYDLKRLVRGAVVDYYDGQFVRRVVESE